MDLTSGSGFESVLAGLAAEALVNSIRGGISLARRLQPSRRRQIHDVTSLIDDDHLRSEVLAELVSVGVAPEVLQLLKRLGAAHFSHYIRRLVEWNLAGVEESAVTSLRRQFLVSGRLYLGEESDRVLGEAFGVLEQAAATAVRAASDDKQTTIDEDLKAGIHANVVTVQLAAIERHLSILVEGEPRLDEFAHKATGLREQVHFRHREIVPPDFERQRRVPIGSLYIAPHLRPVIDGTQFAAETVAPLSLVEGPRRTVVLGAPGGGKSTMASWLCNRLADGPHEGNWRVPFLVTMRDYAQAWTSSPQSFAEYIVDSADYKYQTTVTRPLIEHLLLSGQMVVIFDGLDELLDTSVRRELVASIESFSKAYPFAAILVTSRRVGYNQAPLDVELFDLYVLEEFDVDQVEQYAVRWFDLQDQFSTLERTALADSFIRESSTVSDLRANPLLLALMCLLYRGHRHIPHNRPEVYESCSQLLLVEWDRHRKIFPEIPLDAHVDDCIQHLAGWIFGDPTREAGVTENDLVEELTEYIAEWMVEDIGTARSAAESLVRYCKGRAWILSEVGDDASGSGIFGFTHRTFLEYFTALDLVRSHPTPHDLALAVEARIGDPRWDLVYQIAVHRKNRDTRGAADEVLLYLIERTRLPGSSPQEYVIHFCCAMLELVAPRPSTVARIAEASLRWLADAMVSREQAPGKAIDRSATQDEYSITLVRHEISSTGLGGVLRLLSARSENLTRIRQSFIQCLNEMTGEYGYGAVVVAPLLEALSRQAIGRRAAEFVDLVRADVSPVLESNIRSHEESLTGSIKLVSAGLVPLGAAVTKHGMGIPFTEYEDQRSAVHLPLVLELILAIVDRRSTGDGFVHDAFRDIGDAVLAAGTPALRISGAELSEWPRYLKRFASSIDVTLVDPAPVDDSTFGGIASSYAMVSEIAARAIGQYNVTLIDGSLPGDLAPIRRLLARRFAGEPIGVARTDFGPMFGLPERHAVLLSEWSSNEVDLVSVRP